MSSEKNKPLDVTILDREFRVACPDDERDELLDAVAYLDKNMREIRDAGKITSVERIAIMAGLNVAHELLSQGGGGQTEEARARLARCNALLDSVLEDQDKLF